MEKKNHMGLRVGMMLVGILLIGFCVSFFRLAGFGVDPFTGMNLGISGFIGWTFGTWQLIANMILLIVVFFTVRKCIGAGTIINMVFVGYIADFICWLAQEVIHVEMVLALRIAALLLALLFASLGVALYMKADMGIAPYDSVAVIIEKETDGKIPFHIARVLSDITVLVVGIIFCIAAGNSVWMVAGIGTVCNALFNGPVIRFFREQLDRKWPDL